MTSHAAPAPGASAGRRRALGRGPAPDTTRPADPAPPHTPQDSAESVASGRPTLPLGSREPMGSAGGLGPAESAPPHQPHDSTESMASGRPITPPGSRERAGSAGGRGPVDFAPAQGPRDLPASHEAADPAGRARDDTDGVFRVRLVNFEGPFDLLLQLISRHRLDVTEVALSRVTDEFMAHIRAMGPDWDLDRTTEFLVVAATLLDLKAARLLPVAEVEDEGDLALLEARDLLFARLLQYRAYKQIAGILDRRLDDEARRHPRTVGLEPRYAELLPEVVIGLGAEGMARLAVRAMRPRPRPQVYVDHIHAPLVSVREQAGIVVARLRELGEADFRTLVEDTDDTLTVVARFLALLELYREKAVALDQEAALGPLVVRWTGEAETVPVVTDEFDRPPERPEEKA